MFKSEKALKRLIASEDQRDYLMETHKSLISGAARARGVIMCTAFDAYKNFGNKLIKGENDEEQEVSEDQLKNRVKDSGGELNAARTSFYADAIPPTRTAWLYPRKPLTPPAIPGDDWLYKVASSASDFNARLRASRASRPSFHDSHTGGHLVPRNTQPTRCWVEQVSSERKSDPGAPVDVQFVNRPPIIDWKPSALTEGIKSDNATVLYPLSLTKGQYQESASL